MKLRKKSARGAAQRRTGREEASVLRETGSKRADSSPNSSRAALHIAKDNMQLFLFGSTICRVSSHSFKSCMNVSWVLFKQ